jgi:hypothetical protein
MLRSLSEGGSMKFPRLLIVALLAILVSLNGNAKSSYASRSTHSSHSTTPRSSSSTRATSHSARPYYGGGKHTESHGGQYPGATNEHHKNGHYRSPVTGQDQYGKHKP